MSSLVWQGRAIICSQSFAPNLRLSADSAKSPRNLAITITVDRGNARTPPLTMSAKVLDERSA